MSLLEATLTLPGIAGILLTLGMAVDANILINERIREEQSLGRPPLSALEDGLHKAYNTILDSNADDIPGPCHAVWLRLRPGEGLRGDHHDRHRHVDVHRLDADPADGLPVVLRRRGRSFCRSETRLFMRARASAWCRTTPRIHFMRGRIWPDHLGVAVHRLGRLLFYPGVELGIDFKGGIVMEVRTPGPRRFRPDPRRFGGRAHPASRAAAVRRRHDGAGPPAARSRRGAAPAGGEPRSRGAGQGGAGHQCCGSTRSAPGLGGVVPQRPAGARHQPL